MASYTLRMNELVTAIESAIADKNWVAALFVALSIPDICGYLESPSERAGSRYERWFQEYAAARYSMRSGPEQEHIQFLLGSDCYVLRCALLHQCQETISEQRKREVIDRFHFVAPTDFGVVHCNRINDVLQLQVDIFCMDLVVGLIQWTRDVASDRTIQGRMQKMLKIYSVDDPIGI